MSVSQQCFISLQRLHHLSPPSANPSPHTAAITSSRQRRCDRITPPPSPVHGRGAVTGSRRARCPAPYLRHPRACCRTCPAGRSAQGHLPRGLTYSGCRGRRTRGWTQYRAPVAGYSTVHPWPNLVLNSARQHIHTIYSHRDAYIYGTKNPVLLSWSESPFSPFSRKESPLATVDEREKSE